jgi:hypothetical protein
MTPLLSPEETSRADGAGAVLVAPEEARPADDITATLLAPETSTTTLMSPGGDGPG